MKTYKLITEVSEYDVKDYTILKEYNEHSGEKNWFIKGPYTEADKPNRNGRTYRLDDMCKQVDLLRENYILKNRCTGELEHPTYPEMNTQNAAILIQELNRDGNVFVGKSKVLSTPKGKILECLLHDGVQMGISSRALGSVNDKGIVTEFNLVTFDAVGDPSSQNAFVDGILESKEWICNTDGKYQEVYEGFEDSLLKLPKHDLDTYLKEQIISFMKKLR